MTIFYLPKLVTINGISALLHKEPVSGEVVIINPIVGLIHQIDDMPGVWEDLVNSGIGKTGSARFLTPFGRSGDYYKRLDCRWYSLDLWLAVMSSVNTKQLKKAHYPAYRSWLRSNIETLQKTEFSYASASSDEKIDRSVLEFIMECRNRLPLTEKEYRNGMKDLTSPSIPDHVPQKISYKETYTFDDSLEKILKVARVAEQIEKIQLSKDWKEKLLSHAMAGLSNSANTVTVPNTEMRPVREEPNSPLSVADVCSMRGIKLPQNIRGRAGEITAQLYRNKYGEDEKTPHEKVIAEPGKAPYSIRLYEPKDFDLCEEGGRKALEEQLAKSL